jgi:hypothetical protein
MDLARGHREVDPVKRRRAVEAANKPAHLQGRRRAQLADRRRSGGLSGRRGLADTLLQSTRHARRDCRGGAEHRQTLARRTT